MPREFITSPSGKAAFGVQSRAVWRSLLYNDVNAFERFLCQRLGDNANRGPLNKRNLLFLPEQLILAEYNLIDSVFGEEIVIAIPKLSFFHSGHFIAPLR